MKYLFSLFLLLATNILVFAQAPIYKSQNVSLLGTWDDATIAPNATNINNRYSSCWGYAQKGREYAVVGAQNGVHIVDITNPKAPVRKAFVAGKHERAIWREYKTYQNYLYCISDDAAPNSFQIIDMSYLPDSVKVVYDGTLLFTRGHTISMDKDKMYISGGDSPLTVYSLKNPVAPKLLRNLRNDNPNTNFAHDVFVRNDTIYGSFGYGGMQIYHFNNDSTKFKLLATLTQYPSKGYNHSSLLMPNGKTLLVADEVPNSLPIKIFDASDLKDIKLECTFTSGSKATPHNPFLAPNNRVMMCYYEDGVQVFDVKDPKKPVRTGFFDTHYQSDSINTEGRYLGIWSAYTELPSKNVVAVDMQNGLFVLDARKAYGLPPLTAEDVPYKDIVTISPNPIQDDIIFAAAQHEVANVQIFDVQGKTIVALHQVDVADLHLSSNILPSKGIYFVQIENATFRQIIKIVK